MSQNVTAVPPVNALVTIQPVVAHVSNNTPPQFAALANGTLVEGFVVNRDAQNNPIVRTPLGDLVVQSEVFIKTGSQVIFRMDNSQATRARIVTIDTLTPEQYVAQTPQALTKDTIATSGFKQTTPLPNEPPLANTPQPVLQAVVLQATRDTPVSQAALLPLAAQQTGNVKAPPIPPALAQLAPGTPLTLTVVDVELPPLPIAMQSLPDAPDLTALLPTLTPSPTTPQTTGNSLPKNLPSGLPPALAAAFLATQDSKTAPVAHQTSQPFAPPATAPSPAAYAAAYGGAPVLPGAVPTPPNLPTQTNPAPAGSVNPLPSSALAPPLKGAAPDAAGSAALPSAPASPPATTAQAALIDRAGALQATVIGHAADGSNILHTPFATVKVYTAQPLPTGTNLAIKAEVAPEQAASFTPMLPTFTAPRTAGGTDFDYLGQALAQLQTSDPTLLRDMLQQLPVLGPKFTSGLLFFLTAVKTGDVREILGNRAFNRLQALNPNLLARLSKDIGALQQLFQHSPFEEWKAITLPMIFGQEVDTARLYIRKEPEEEKAASHVGGQRFLLDVELSQLGPMQLDGFVRSGARAKSLELYLRTDAPLENAITQEIRTLFETSLATTGLTGHILFQSGGEHFVKPALARPGAASGESGQTILA